MRRAIRAHAARSSPVPGLSRRIPIEASTASSVSGAATLDMTDSACHSISLRGSPSHVWSIVHVLSSFGVGGQERVALDLAIGQQARGHRVSVISLAPPPDGAMADEFATAGIPTTRVVKRDGIDPTLVPRLANAMG